jgi:hypothetical protein
MPRPRSSAITSTTGRGYDYPLRHAGRVEQVADYGEGKAGVVEILRAGGAAVTDNHRELATEAGVPAVIDALVAV